MTHYRLAAGTDVAEMALFDIDDLPRARPPNKEELKKLASKDSLVRMPIGSDGGYLLHLYVNEHPPEEIARYCIAEDELKGQFFTNTGNIAFGGLESTFQEFRPNRLIRSDTLIAAGRYSFYACRTDIPEEVVKQATRVDGTPRERWLDKAPLLSNLSSLGVVFALAIFQKFIAAGMMLILAYFCFKAIKRISGQDALATRREEAQSDFPDIVIELWAQPSV